MAVANTLGRPPRFPSGTAEDVIAIGEYLTDIYKALVLEGKIATRLKAVEETALPRSDFLASLLPYTSPAPNGLTRAIAEHLSEGMEHATAYGVPSDGVTDATRSLKAFLERCGHLYFPKGRYLIARVGPDSGGVGATIRRHIRVVCHPDAEFIAGSAGLPLDNNMITFDAPSDGAGLPAGGIDVSWVGGYFDQVNHCVSTSVPFLSTYPAPAGLAGTSSTCDALSFKLSYTVASVSYNAARSTYVGDVVFYAGSHWELAGGDSGIFMGGGSGQARISRCFFYGSRDLGIYSSGVASGRQGITIDGCYFENCFGGFSAKRGQSGYVLTGNTFRNCIVAMASSPLTRVSENGYVAGNIWIGCGIGFRASGSDDNVFVGNQAISIGAMRADGVTPCNPYGFSALIWLSGASGNSITDLHCYTRTVGSTGDRYGVLMRDNGSFISSGNYISGIRTDDFRYCVANEGTGSGNYIDRSYNYNASINDPLPGNDFLVRMDPTTGGPIYRNPVRYANGSAAAPIISREAQASTGIYFDTSEVAVSIAGTARFQVRSGGSISAGLIRPSVDNTHDLGSSSERWAQLRAASGTINTSDERAKRDIEAIPDEWLDAWGDVEWCRYRFTDGQRWHVGLVAQRVEAAFAARGLDARAIGLLCHDEWDDQYEPIMEEAREPIYGEDGSVIGHQTVERPTGQQRLIRAAGDRYGLRYDECMAMEAAWSRRELARLRALH